MARASGGRFLLRIEDIDLARAEPAYVEGIFQDLEWLGLEWETPVRIQSEHLHDYRSALEALRDEGLVYPSFMSRGEVKRFVADHEAENGEWPRDPDGTPLYPPEDRRLPESERSARIAEGMPHAWRLDMAEALRRTGHDLSWIETGAGPDGETGHIAARPGDWGDVILARQDAPGSYHLAVVVDDAIQGVTDVVRGRDLFHATSIHRVLQELLGLPCPHWHHHALVLGEDGLKLSKSRKDTALAELRAAGLSAADIRRMVMAGGDEGQ